MTQPTTRQTRTAATVQFEGAPNFRSVAALPAGNGQSIRPNRLFRSDALHRLTPADLQRFAQLGIGSVLDLRRPDERSWAPNRLPSAAMPETLVFDNAVEIDAVRPATWRNQLASAQFDASAARDWMRDTYRRLPQAFSRSIRLASERLSGQPGAEASTTTTARPSREPHPIIVHCTAGKDRTGFVCAMLLSALGVPWEAVMEDYLESRHRRPPHDLAIALLGDDARNLPAKALDAIAVIAGVEPDFLDTAFATVRQDYDSVDRYLQTACGLGASERQRLGEYLLLD